VYHKVGVHRSLVEGNSKRAQSSSFVDDTRNEDVINEEADDSFMVSDSGSNDHSRFFSGRKRASSASGLSSYFGSSSFSTSFAVSATSASTSGSAVTLEEMSSTRGKQETQGRMSPSSSTIFPSLLRGGVSFRDTKDSGGGGLQSAECPSPRSPHPMAPSSAVPSTQLDDSSFYDFRSTGTS